MRMLTMASIAHGINWHQSTKSVKCLHIGKLITSYARLNHIVVIVVIIWLTQSRILTVTHLHWHHLSENFYFHMYWPNEGRHNLGLYSLSGRTSYHKISWSLKAARFGFRLFQSFWNLTGTLAAALPRCQPNFRAIRSFKHPISRPGNFIRFGNETSVQLVNRGPGYFILWHLKQAIT